MTCFLGDSLAQEEYAREGIDWSYVEFIDNQDCLDCLEGAPDAPSLAVFPLIDEACRLPRATYQVRLAPLLLTRPPAPSSCGHTCGHQGPPSLTPPACPQLTCLHTQTPRPKPCEPTFTPQDASLVACCT